MFRLGSGLCLMIGSMGLVACAGNLDSTEDDAENVETTAQRLDASGCTFTPYPPQSGNVSGQAAIRGRVDVDCSGSAGTVHWEVGIVRRQGGTPSSSDVVRSSFNGWTSGPNDDGTYWGDWAQRPGGYCYRTKIQKQSNHAVNDLSSTICF